MLAALQSSSSDAVDTVRITFEEKLEMPMIRSGILSLFIVACAFSTQNVHAFWGWMADSAAADFSDADWEILKATARETLDTSPDGEQVNWINETSGNKGAMKPIMTFTYDNQHCRRMAFLNVSQKGQRDVVNYNLCQQPDTTWKFVADSVVSASQN